MPRVLSNTVNYKRTALYETETTRIILVEDKNDKRYDNIKFIKLGEYEYREPETVVVYRYEDEQLIEDMLKMYGAE